MMSPENRGFFWGVEVLVRSCKRAVISCRWLLAIVLCLRSLCMRIAYARMCLCVRALFCLCFVWMCDLFVFMGIYVCLCLCMCVWSDVYVSLCVYVCLEIWLMFIITYCACVWGGEGVCRVCAYLYVFLCVCAYQYFFCAYVLICMYFCAYVFISTFFCAYVLICMYFCAYVSSEFSIYLSIMTFRYTHWKTHADDRQQNSLWKPLYRVKAHQFCIFQSCALIKRRKQSDYIKRGWQMTLHAKSH